MNYLTTKEAAVKLNYTSDACIRKLIRQGKLNYIKRGRDLFIPEEELGRVKRVRKQYNMGKS